MGLLSVHYGKGFDNMFMNPVTTNRPIEQKTEPEQQPRTYEDTRRLVLSENQKNNS